MYTEYYNVNLADEIIVQSRDRISAEKEPFTIYFLMNVPSDFLLSLFQNAVETFEIRGKTLSIPGERCKIIMKHI